MVSRGKNWWIMWCEKLLGDGHVKSCVTLGAGWDFCLRRLYQGDSAVQCLTGRDVTHESPISDGRYPA